uniref:Uncharacterized protein n=1 Tax=Bodo saltans TaxID=75058 RepID=B6DTE4_BODSA|nr:hypothetical protein [Bodo saltans]
MTSTTTPLHGNTPYSPVVQFPNSLNSSYMNLSNLNVLQSNMPQAPINSSSTGTLQKVASVPLNRHSRSRAIFVAVLISVAVLLSPYWIVDRGQPASLVVAPPTLVYVPARPDRRVVWDSLLKIGSQSSNGARSSVKQHHPRSDDVARRGGGRGGVRIMFLGDSITEGGAANTTHPRKHPNGSCSYRFSFLAHIAAPGGRRSAAAVRALAANNSSRTTSLSSKRLSPHHISTVGPFSSNCGDVVVPDKCFGTLRKSWGNDKGLGLYDMSTRSIHWRRHASVSGVTALGLIRHREAWQKRDTCYGKSGILKEAPALPPIVLAMENTYRMAFPQRVNVSDVAVWAALYEPHLVLVLLGTNDLRWGRDWTEILYESLPAVLHEVLWAADRRVSPLLASSTQQADDDPGPADAATPLSDPAVIGRRPSRSLSSGHHSINGQYKPSSTTVCSTFAVLSTLYPRTEYAAELEAFNMALRGIQRRRQTGVGLMCPTPDAFLHEHALSLMSGETFLLCHPCIRVIDGGAPVVEATGATMPKSEFLLKYTFDGLHPNDEGDDQLGLRMANLLMTL